MAIPDSPFTYVAYDLVTARYLGRVPLTNVSFGSQLLQPGTLTGTIDIASDAVRHLSPLSCTAPARTLLAVDFLGALVWGGIVWPRSYRFDGTKRVLQVTATEVWSYIASRMQATDYSAPPYSGLSGSAKMTIWNASNTDNIGVYDPVLICWQLIADALQVSYGSLLGGLAIAANGLTTPSAYLASGTATPQADYLSVTYPFASLQQLGSIISMLAGNGLGVGFDYAVDVAYSSGPGSPPVGTVNLSYPRRGRPYSATGLVLNCGQALSYEVPEDGSATGNTVYEQGSSGSLVVSQNINPLQAGYPVIEQLRSRANITSANILNVLASLGVSDLATGSYPVTTPTVTTDLFTGPIQLGEFIVGDDVRWIVPAATAGGAGSYVGAFPSEVFDPRFPDGYDAAGWRIVGYRADVKGSGQSTLTLNLALAPVYVATAPAVP